MHVLAWLLAAPAVGFVLPPLAGSPRSHVSQQPQQLRSHRMAMVDESNAKDVSDGLEASIDALVRAEVEAAFSGLEATLEADDDEAIKLIEQKGQEVMQSVLDKLEADGELLSSSLTSQVEALSMARQKQMLAEFDESTAKLQRRMLEERQTIRDEMDRLSALNDDYKSLARGGGGGGLNRDTIVGSVSFIVGLTYASSSLNELLKVATGGGNDASPATIAINAALGVAGVGYYFFRKSQSEEA